MGHQKWPVLRGRWPDLGEITLYAKCLEDIISWVLPLWILVLTYFGLICAERVINWIITRKKIIVTPTNRTRCFNKNRTNLSTNVTYLDTFINNVSRYVTLSRYIWNVTYLDTFINNVSRYVTLSRYIWNVTVTYLDTFGM